MGGGAVLRRAGPANPQAAGAGRLGVGGAGAPQNGAAAHHCPSDTGDSWLG